MEKALENEMDTTGTMGSIWATVNISYTTSGHGSLLKDYLRHYAQHEGGSLCPVSRVP